jgi:hypothetical protein
LLCSRGESRRRFDLPQFVSGRKVVLFVRVAVRSVTLTNVAGLSQAGFAGR